MPRHPRSSTGRATGPVGLRASFALDEPADLFLDTRGWGKGYAWVNGFFLGRYWRRGPQRTLFVPAPVTRAGENVVAIVEFEASPMRPRGSSPDPTWGTRSSKGFQCSVSGAAEEMREREDRSRESDPPDGTSPPDCARRVSRRCSPAR